MILKVFAVHDSKVGAYLQPFFQRSKGEALRSWEGVCNDGQSAMSKFPADFTLFEIGEYDDSTGVIKPHEAKISLATGLEGKVKADAQMPMFPSQLRAQ